MAFAPLPRLAHGEAVRSFLLGRWAVSKTFDYRKGGGRGVLEGSATFTDVPEKKGVLMYEERGDMQLDGFPRPVEAYRFYCFNTSCWPVEVYFVDDPTKKHLPSLLPELAVHTSFFVPLAFEGAGSPESLAAFRHLCIDDLYSGQLRVNSADSFEWNWSVQGPNKDGDIKATYRRISS
ncbi:unnamed protein product [Symbiodinium natans]|uniref:DUF6314 domain-containing protein n=1 Tax=Symbiodinium natans TaxID=878477 RepID=A0A812H3G7_9DINO|nr:unnamed protein product [Symbiodinium natans]